MSRYVLCLTAFVSRGFGVEVGESRDLELSFEDPMVARIGCAEKGGLKQITIRIDNIDTREYALEVGERMKRALSFYGVKGRCGINLGNDSSTLQFSEDVIKDIFMKTGQSIIPTVHGLVVVEQDLNPVFIDMSIEIETKYPFEYLSGELCGYVSSGVDMSDRCYLASKMYNAAQFSRSNETKLLMLVSAVEVLAAQNKAPKSRKTFVKDLVEPLISTHVQDEEEQKALKKAVGGLLQYGESKSEACKRYVRDSLFYGKLPLFEEMYNVRSRLMHDGVIPCERDFYVKVNELDQLVSELILHSLS